MFNTKELHQDLTDRWAFRWIFLKCVFHQLMKVLREDRRKSFIEAVTYLVSASSCIIKTDEDMRSLKN